MRGKLLVCIALLLVALVAVWIGCSEDKPVAPDSQQREGPAPAELSGLLIGPMHGLTTEWHPAPSRLVVPRDAGPLQFKCQASANATVTWRGAVEVSRDGFASVAECSAPEPGVYRRVEASVVAVPDDGDGAAASGDAIATLSCTLSAADLAIADIRVNDFELSAKPLPVDAGSGDAERIQVLLSSTPIGTVTKIGPTRYRAAAGTTVRVSVALNHAELAPLVEWRVDGKAALVGSEGEFRLPPAEGTRVISVGPPGSTREATIDAYSVLIKVDGGQIIPGQEMTFRATTNPPGYEDEVVWMAATLFGTSSPALGKGATFKASFSDPLPTTDDGVLCMGVRGSSSTLIVETPPVIVNPCDALCVPPLKYCLYNIVWVGGIAPLGCPANIVVGNTVCVAPCPCMGAAPDACPLFQLFRVAGTNCHFLGQQLPPPFNVCYDDCAVKYRVVGGGGW